MMKVLCVVFLRHGVCEEYTVMIKIFTGGASEALHASGGLSVRLLSDNR